MQEAPAGFGLHSAAWGRERVSGMTSKLTLMEAVVQSASLV